MITSPTEILLSVKNLSIHFKTDTAIVHAIKAIDFDILKGETLAIVGESGSGKSVTSLAIMGLLPKPPAIIESGTILFEGVDILKLSEKELNTIRGNKIAMVFQEPMTSLNPLMKCGLQVAESIILHKKISKQIAHQQVLDLFAEVQIPEPEKAFEKYPHEMSGGQKQRVMIAMALSCNPQLIIADEPTTALDVQVQKNILELLKTIQKNRGTSILFITHDLGLVKQLADKTIVLYKGEIVEQNITTAIFNNPQAAYTKALINCKPNTKQLIKVLPVVADFLNTQKTFEPQIVSKQDVEARQLILKNAENIIEIKNLNIEYAGSKNIFGKSKTVFKALHDITLEIKKGETLGLVGESGCGKTTLGKTIVRLNTPTSGTVTYLGKDIFKDWNNDYCKAVQIIFQDPYSSLNPRITIGDAIVEPIKVHHILPKDQQKNRVLELLQKVDLLPEHYDRYPHEFSGGQRQRICIARALASNPKLIVCDESVSALDVSVQAQVLNLLVALRDEFNLSLLFISHDLSVVKHLCDRIVVMQKGTIIENNSAFEIFENPKTDYTKMLLADVPSL
jgi:peptide/nickel transport system ATP-binding protein